MIWIVLTQVVRLVALGCGEIRTLMIWHKKKYRPIQIWMVTSSLFSLKLIIWNPILLTLDLIDRVACLIYVAWGWLILSPSCENHTNREICTRGTQNEIFKKKIVTSLKHIIYPSLMPQKGQICLFSTNHHLLTAMAISQIDHLELYNFNKHAKR